MYNLEVASELSTPTEGRQRTVDLAAYLSDHMHRTQESDAPRVQDTTGAPRCVTDEAYWASVFRDQRKAPPSGYAHIRCAT